MYDEKLADLVREKLAEAENVTEKKMFQGLCFMVNDKMCISVRNRELMCRIGPEKAEAELERGNCREMIHHGKVMKGYIFVDEFGHQDPKDLQRLVDLCLAFNKEAKASKKKKK